MRKILALLVLSLCIFIRVDAQTDMDAIVVSIGDKDITKGEFVRIYKKNNSPQSEDNKTVDEYMQMFIDFKLKVLEAENMGIDTTNAFINELSGYRKQLAKPYFVDESIIDSLIKEAYNRMKQEVRAAHILIKIPENAPPKDTLKAYNQIMKLRTKAMKGEDFGKMAAQFSDDSLLSARGGDLGFFTAFQMYYPFENAAYNTPIGEISMPLRTKYGYHIIKVKDRRKAKGRVRAAHIMLLSPKDAGKEQKEAVKNKIDDIYEELKNGKDFKDAVNEYSQDANSARRGGDLGWFRSGDMVPEFSEAAYSIENIGDISEPVRTAFGWHIIKLLDKQSLEPFEDIKEEIRQKISYLPQSELSKTVVIDRLKEKYDFEDFNTVSEFYDVVDSTVFTKGWDASKAKHLTKKMFKIGDNTYTQKDFNNFLASAILRVKPSHLNEYVDKKYSDFVSKKVIEYEDKRLEEIYPEFAYLMQEYHDGILLFELTDKEVWSKAINDTVGLRAFYEQHKFDKPEYSYGKRLDVSVFEYNTEDGLKKLLKVLKKKERKSYTDKYILETVNKNDSTELSIIQSGQFEKGEEKIVDTMFEMYQNAKIHAGEYIVQQDNNRVLFLNKYLKPQPKPLAEIRGLITAEYQNYLENEWIKELREKYEVTIYEDVLSTIEE